MNRRKFEMNDEEDVETEIGYSDTKPWYNSRALSVLAISWVIFSTLLGLLMIVIFVQAHWLGTSEDYFGLYYTCTEKEGSKSCSGSLSNFAEILSGEWQGATVLILLAFLIEFGAVITFVVYWCKHVTQSFLLAWCCVILQFVSGLFVLIACLLYPAGWGTAAVRAVCGESVVAFNRGHCEPQWAYGLAWLCAADSLILSILLGCFIEKQRREPRQGNRGRASANGSLHAGRANHSMPPQAFIIGNNHAGHVGQTTAVESNDEDTMM